MVMRMIEVMILIHIYISLFFLRVEVVIIPFWDFSLHLKFLPLLFPSFIFQSQWRFFFFFFITQVTKKLYNP